MEHDTGVIISPLSPEGVVVRVTISDVARRAEVSKKTVSRVINNEATVAESTRQRVLRAIKELDYSPNPWAQNLARGKSGLVALIFHDAGSPYIMDVLRGLMDAGESVGHGVSIHRCNIEKAEDVAQIIRVASHHIADGMVFTPPCDNSPTLIQALEALEFPFVLLTPNSRHCGYSWVAATDEQGSYEAARYLIGLGHRRIGYIQGNPQHRASWDRLTGYERALETAGLEINAAYVKQGDWTFETGVTLAHQLLELRPRPTAIMAGGDGVAAGVIQAAWKRGLTLPAELSVIGFDDAPFAHQLWPPLTTVRQPVTDIAAAAMRILADKLISHQSTAQTVEIPTELIVRNSTAPPLDSLT